MDQSTPEATLPRLLKSSTTVRFQHCDPYGHLNNSTYLDYFMNAREDQVLENYGLDIYELGHTDGVAWVVAQNHIAYHRACQVDGEGGYHNEGYWVFGWNVEG